MLTLKVNASIVRGHSKSTEDGKGEGDFGFMVPMVPLMLASCFGSP